MIDLVVIFFLLCILAEIVKGIQRLYEKGNYRQTTLEEYRENEI